MIEVEYKMPASGLGTDFSQSERPLSFAEAYSNRFRNVTGGAERRPGMGRFSSPVTGAPTLTRLHEWVSNSGSEVLLSSDDQGNIWTYNVSASAWQSSLTGKAQLRLISAQAEDYLIFVNGSDRNFYTRDGGQTYNELKAFIVQGTLAGGSNTTTIIDGNIANWISQTLVANNDIVYNVTRGGYGIISTVASASLTTTVIGTLGNGAGLTASNQAAGDAYQLIDYVALNIIPQGQANKTDVGILTTGTTTTVVAVSGVNFANTEIRTGDIIYNTTRGAVALVGSVSANVNLQQAITGQVTGDTAVFLKSAMPIASWIHVHYGRVYMIDSRNKTRVVVTAPDDPQDVTTYQQTLDSTSFSFGTQQPTGDALLSLTSFQQYFVASGERNLYIYRGITPIQDSSATTVDFTPIAFYPNGVSSRFGLGTNGTDLLHVTLEGLQAINLGSISFTTVQNNVSVPVRSALLSLISNAATDDVQISFYPRRSWLILKAGTSCYVLNTNPSYDETGQLASVPAWHLFTGKWAQQNHYFVRRDGTLLACGSSGLVYTLDTNNATDDGSVIPTDLKMAWLRLEEPQRTPRVKTGYYIRPIFESVGNIGYNINVIAGWDGFSVDNIVVSSVNVGSGQIGVAIIGTTPIGAGTEVQADKYPLRWRGEQAKIQFTTNSSELPDVITGFMIYGDIGGVR